MNVFNLETAITDWRKRMRSSGIRSRALDELESHLREDVDRCERDGLSLPQAFEKAAQRLGAPELLKPEFQKIGWLNILPERAKNFMRALAGIPTLTLATNMITSDSHSNLEPRWATYLKSATFVLPAVCLWTFSVVFLFPKLNEICQHAGVAIPGVYGLVLGLMQYALVLVGAFALTVGLLEWRSTRWVRYRRIAFGLGVFVVNSVAILFITGMVILALISASQLLQHGK